MSDARRTPGRMVNAPPWTTLAVAACAAACLLCGCTTRPRTPPGPATVVLAVAMAGGGAPSSQQLATIHRVLAPQLARAGFAFAPSAESADFVVTANFTPSAADPNSGHVAVLGAEPTARFRTRFEESPEAKEMRQRLREIERWEERQSRDNY